MTKENETFSFETVKDAAFQILLSRLNDGYFVSNGLPD